MHCCIGILTAVLFLTLWETGVCLSSEELTSRLESSRNWFFKRSDVYKGRRYYLSQQDPISRSEQSMATCVLYGGYLAEIDDVDEYNFIKTFIKQFSGFRIVLIGGTDEETEEVWKYRTSKKLVPEFLLKSRKYGTARNCLYLFDADDWLGVDDLCYYNVDIYPTRYLCEIPESTTCP
ncbi:hypothetical protein Btru_072448 [Bulinus truncatus]|nr:hypothetical protein Btru_072448 [Bulinus truncatus]